MHVKSARANSEDLRVVEARTSSPTRYDSISSRTRLTNGEEAQVAHSRCASDINGHDRLLQDIHATANASAIEYAEV